MFAPFCKQKRGETPLSLGHVSLLSLYAICSEPAAHANKDDALLAITCLKESAYVMRTALQSYERCLEHELKLVVLTRRVVLYILRLRRGIHSAYGCLAVKAEVFLVHPVVFHCRHQLYIDTPALAHLLVIFLHVLAKP